MKMFVLIFIGISPVIGKSCERGTSLLLLNSSNWKTWDGAKEYCSDHGGYLPSNERDIAHCMNEWLNDDESLNPLEVWKEKITQQSDCPVVRVENYVTHYIQQVINKNCSIKRRVSCAFRITQTSTRRSTATSDRTVLSAITNDSNYSTSEGSIGTTTANVHGLTSISHDKLLEPEEKSEKWILPVICVTVGLVLIGVASALTLICKKRRTKNKNVLTKKKTGQHLPKEKAEDVYHIYDEAKGIYDEPQESVALSDKTKTELTFPGNETTFDDRGASNNQRNSSDNEYDAEGYLTVIPAEEDSVHVSDIGATSGGTVSTIAAVIHSKDQNYEVLNRDELYGNTDKHMYEMIEKKHRRKKKK